jgi:hypothetical protein
VPVPQDTPYGLVSAAVEVQEASKRELVLVTRRLERAAVAHRPPAVAATLQDVRYLTERTRAVYAALAAVGAPARLHARGLQAWLAPGVTGVSLDDDDPLVDEWTVVLPGDDPVVFAATDLGNTDCDDDERCFRYGISKDPQLVADCGRLLGI